MSTEEEIYENLNFPVTNASIDKNSNTTSCETTVLVQIKQTASEKAEREKLILKSKLQATLNLVGLTTVILGASNLLVGIISLCLASNPTQFYSFLWAGVPAAILNGSLLLHATTMDSVSKSWMKIIFNVGIAALAMYSLDLILTFAMIGISSGSQSACSGSALATESARVVIISVLIILASFQVFRIKKYRDYLPEIEPAVGLYEKSH